MNLRKTTLNIIKNPIETPTNKLLSLYATYEKDKTIEIAKMGCNALATLYGSTLKSKVNDAIKKMEKRRIKNGPSKWCAS